MLERFPLLNRIPDLPRESAQYLNDWFKYPITYKAAKVTLHVVLGNIDQPVGCDPHDRIAWVSRESVLGVVILHVCLSIQ